jgi:hypothetical protein
VKRYLRKPTISAIEHVCFRFDRFTECVCKRNKHQNPHNVDGHHLVLWFYFVLIRKAANLQGQRDSHLFQIARPRSPAFDSPSTRGAQHPYDSVHSPTHPSIP